MKLESIIVYVWQVIFLGVIASWVILSSMLNVTKKVRSLIQPWVTDQVTSGTDFVLQIQKCQNCVLDVVFTGLSCFVSVPFYTAFLPLLFWKCIVSMIQSHGHMIDRCVSSGHYKLARQMTLLMAFCDYIGNSIKDVVSAPRPISPPVRRLTETKDEEGNALEYGLPSSHTLNTLCLLGYLLHYILSYYLKVDILTLSVGLAIIVLLVFVTGLGRIYLGMHSLIDIIGGLVLGLFILALWLSIHTYIDDFVVSKKDVVPFWVVLSFLLLFAYPTPEFSTPSFEFHTAFNGVALGAVIGIQQTHHLFHFEDVPHTFTAQLSLRAFLSRVALGIPTILLVKFCSKTLAKWILPTLAHILSIPVKSSGYVSALRDPSDDEKPVEMQQIDQKLCAPADIENPVETKQTCYLQKLFFFSHSHQYTFDVDTGIRFVQYVGLAWSVFGLVPYLFSLLSI